MQFLADMGVGMKVVEWLNSRGHDAIHLREQGLERLPNGEIFDKAVDEGRVVLTFDLDFGEIAATTSGSRASVIVFRLHNTRVTHVIDRLRSVLAESSAALNGGVVITVEESRHRIRRFPIGRHDI